MMGDGHTFSTFVRLHSYTGCFIHIFQWALCKSQQSHIRPVILSCHVRFHIMYAQRHILCFGGLFCTVSNGEFC